MKPILVWIDPGARGCGVALWRDGYLAACAYVRNPAKEGAGPAECAAMAWAVAKWVSSVATSDEIAEARLGLLSHPEQALLPGVSSALALEWPQVYQRGGGRTVGDPNDLLPLAAVDGALAALFPCAEVLHCRPSEWKGNLTKEACAHRARERLSAEESAVLVAGLEGLAKSLQHNVLDACALGLWFLGRFEKKRVIARE